MDTCPYLTIGIKPIPSSELLGDSRCGQCEVAQILDSLTDRNVKRAGTECQLAMLSMVEGDPGKSWIRSKSNEVSPLIPKIIADHDVILGGDRRQYRAERGVWIKRTMGSGKGTFLIRDSCQLCIAENVAQELSATVDQGVVLIKAAVQVGKTRLVEQDDERVLLVDELLKQCAITVRPEGELGLLDVDISE